MCEWKSWPKMFENMFSLQAIKFSNPNLELPSLVFVFLFKSDFKNISFSENFANLLNEWSLNCLSKCASGSVKKIILAALNWLKSFYIFGTENTIYERIILT